MTAYGIIDPFTRHIALLQCESFEVALRAAGLKPGEVDFGNVTPRLTVVVYEYSLVDRKQSQRFFALFPGGRGDLGILFGGGAVLFQTDDTGATVDLDPPDWLALTEFYDDGHDADWAIRKGRVDRPRQSINGVICWEWGP